MAASNASPFEILDFRRGITDDVFTQVAGAAEALTNFLIRTDGKPISRYGSELDNKDFPEIPTGASVDGLVNYASSDKLFYQSFRSLYYRNPSNFTELLGPSGNRVFSDGDSLSAQSYAQWNRHLYVTNDAYTRPMVIYKDTAGIYQLRSSSLPALANDPTITAGGVGENIFLYAFHYTYTYTVFGLTYQIVGPVTYVSLENASDPVSGNNVISNLPVITNGATENFDTANIKLEIYRSEANQTFLMKVGEVTNGTTTFIDSVSDDTLSNTGVNLYTNDGTVDFDPVPLHKYNHIVNNIAYYAHIIDEDGESPYKVRQSVPGVPGTAPLDFEMNVDDQIKGISSAQSSPMVFCTKYIYRIDQFFDQFGRGGMQPVRISDHAGCISHLSIVPAEEGIFWLGNDGVYYSDSYKVIKVTDHLNDRYKSFLKNTTNAKKLEGKFYEKERLVVWAIQTNAASQNKDTFLVLDLKWGISNEMTFTTWNGASFRPSAIEIFNGDIYRGDDRGFTFRHDQNLASDLKLDVFKTPSLWIKETIRWQIKTLHYNFGGTFFRKYPTRVLLTGVDIGNTTIQITAVNDDGKFIRKCKPIRVRRNFVWRDDDFIWRVSDFIWRAAGLIEQWRRFPAGGLRLSTLQLIIENGYSDITNSDTLGNATYNSTTKIITLDNASSKWPLDSEDYYIASESDGYVKEYLIAERVDDSTISVIDPLNTLPNGSLQWVIRGYKKDEPLHLLGINIHWTNVSASQEKYDSSAAGTGENA